MPKRRRPWRSCRLGEIEGLAAYLAGFVGELAAAGASFFAIPAITPHICLAELRRRVSLPIVDVLQVAAQRLRDRQLSRVALFGTKFTIDSSLFGALDGCDIVRPRDEEVDEIHRIYLELATRGKIRPTMKRGCATWPALLAGGIASKRSYWPALTSTSLKKRMPAFPQSIVPLPISMRSWRRCQVSFCPDDG